MKTTVLTKGQTVIPEAVREQAHWQPGDTLDVGYANGLVVLRKHKPLTRAKARSLVLSGRDLREMTAKDADEVADAIKTVRRRRHA